MSTIESVKNTINNAYSNLTTYVSHSISFLFKYYLTGLLIVIIIIITTIVTKNSIELKSMNGFWKASAEFCESADLSTMLFYIGDRNWWGERPGYILAQNSDGIILNNPVTFKLSSPYYFNPFNHYFNTNNERIFNCTIDWLDETEIPDFFPAIQKIKFCPEKNKIEFYTDEQVYAELYKDTITSSAISSSNPY